MTNKIIFISILTVLPIIALAQDVNIKPQLNLPIGNDPIFGCLKSKGYESMLKAPFSDVMACIGNLSPLPGLDGNKIDKQQIPDAKVNPQIKDINNIPKMFDIKSMGLPGSTVDASKKDIVAASIIQDDFTRNLKMGDKGVDVKAMQKILVEEGYLPIRKATGYFGPTTFAALKEFQQDNNLKDNGIFGKDVMGLLINFADKPIADYFSIIVKPAEKPTVNANSNTNTNTYENRGQER